MAREVLGGVGRGRAGGVRGSPMCRALTGLCLLLCLVLPRTTWALNTGLGEPPATVDRTTPYAAANGFLDAAHRGDYALAAHFLDLDYIPRANRRPRGRSWRASSSSCWTTSWSPRRSPP